MWPFRKSKESLEEELASKETQRDRLVGFGIKAAWIESDRLLKLDGDIAVLKIKLARRK